MKLETIKIANLTPDPQNARTHDDTNLKAIEGSLKEFGQRKPIVVTQDNVIAAGNGTVEAAKRLGWTDIQAVRVPADWDEDRIKAFALADNRTAELASWNPEVMASQLVDLQEAGFDIEEFGFEVADPPIDLDSIEEDVIPEQVISRAALGDIWQLGKHKLLCGDSTDIETIGKLMSGDKASLVFTDPPYGVEYQSNMRTKSNRFDVLANDDTFLDVSPVITAHSQGWVFIWTSWKVQSTWIEMFKDYGYPTNIIVWHKPGGGIGDLKKTFSSDYEVALVWHRGAELTGKRIGSVWTINKDGATTYLHPTQKPVALAAEAIDKTTHSGAMVLDLFGGSGSTLIACEQTNRVARLAELDPKYCDVIIQRWENLTGEKAELLK